MNQVVDKHLTTQSGSLIRSNEGLRAEIERLRADNASLRSQLDKSKTQGQAERQYMRASLSLVEDAVKARREVEVTSAALKVSEERLQTLSDAVPQLIWTNNHAGVANYFNKRWYEYSGLTPEQSAGLGWQAIVHQDDAPFSNAKWRQALVDGKVFETEYRLRAAKGNYRWFIGRNVPLYSEDGKVSGWFGSATDIDDLKNAETQIREREEQFRRAIQEAPIPVIMQAEDGQVLQISTTWTELTGYAQEDIPTFDSWLHHAYGPGAEMVRSHVQQLFTGEIRQVEVEFDVTTRSGEVRYWAFSASAPGSLTDGRRFIVGMALDITERQRATRALALSEERFRVALEAGGMASWDFDLLSKRVIWNDQHYRLLGLPVDDKEKKPDDFFRYIHSDDQARIKEELRKASEETGVYRADFRVVRSDGVVRWMSGYGKSTEHKDGKIVRMSGVMLDITEEHEATERLAAAEERLRLLVESALEHAIIGLDPERKVTTWNPGAARITGYQAVEVVGHSIDIIFTPEDRAAGVPERETFQAIEEGRASDNRWLQRKDGTKYWARGAMLPMRSRAGGDIIGFVKIAHDETEVQQAREALESSRHELKDALQQTEKSRAEAERANRAKDNFLAVLSHELRTPLTPVTLATRTLLRRVDLTEPVRDALHMISRNVEVESHLVDDLLDVTRIAHGKMELLKADMDMHEAIAHAVEISRPDMEAKQQHFTMRLEAHQFEVHGDKQRLKQVVWNVLKNASKFTPEKGQISLRTYNEGDRLMVEISDTGIGMEPSALDLIFAPFTQANRDITREFGGLGLGLAIARASLSGHNGELTVNSEGLSRGSTFICSLPTLPAND